MFFRFILIVRENVNIRQKVRFNKSVSYWTRFQVPISADQFYQAP